MGKEGGWVKPEDLHAVFRCTTQDYAEKLLTKGEIKFNTPDSWVKYAFEKGEGRGDKLEGTMATFHIDDIDSMIELNEKYNKYSDLIHMRIKQRVYLKRTRNMQLPYFCFYVLKQSMFECPQKVGEQRLVATVPSSYFKDFIDNLDPQEVDKLDSKDKPAVIFVKDFKEFQQRIINALMEIGLTKEQIIFTRISYIDFEKYGQNGWWDFNWKPPMELSIKDKRFEPQSEARIIINTDNTRIKKILEKPIQIGPLEDIVQISNTYFYEGMRIELNCKLELLE